MKAFVVVAAFCVAFNAAFGTVHGVVEPEIPEYLEKLTPEKCQKKFQNKLEDLIHEPQYFCAWCETVKNGLNRRLQKMCYCCDIICPENYYWDFSMMKCVPETCRASEACEEGWKCFPVDVECGCGMSWCAQYRCCPPGTEYSEILKECVPVTCEARDACPEGVECIDLDYPVSVCAAPPCPRYTCLK